MQHKYIIANWKMNGSTALVGEWAQALSQQSAGIPAYARLVICPPTPYLQAMRGMLHSPQFALGAQDCHAEDAGAFTSDVSAPMLKDVGVEYVIIGHSERRLAYGEPDAEVCNKAKAAIKHGLTPIVCVGESLADRQAGRAVEVVIAQVKASVPIMATANILLAYEPIWAIGSGQIPRMEEIGAMHAALANALHEHTSQKISVVYGGSVNAGNAKEILHTPNVSGVLVGSASLKADSFEAIARSV